MNEPSQKALDLLGKTVTHDDGRRKRSGTVDRVEALPGVITRDVDGTTWTVTRYRIKPDDGRAFWTTGMPDREIEIR